MEHCVNVSACELPVSRQTRNHGPFEALVELQRFSVVAQIVCQNGQCQLCGAAAAVIFTTHSPTSIIALPVGDLYFVRSKGGETTVSQVDKNHWDRLQGIARTRPLAFLGRKLLLCEGATEVGLIRGLIPHWTKEKEGRHPVNVGFVYIDGKGRTAAPPCALELKRVGYDVALLADTDEPIEPDASTLDKAGVVSFLWEGKMSTEQRLMADLPVESVQEIINAAIDEYGPDAINSHVSEFSGKKLAGLGNSFEGWLKSGLTETQLRSAIGTAAKVGKFGGKKAGWFKDVTLGVRLGEIIGSAMPKLKGKPTEKLLSALAAWIYG